MEGDSLSMPCDHDSALRGTDRADAICGSRYETDVDMPHRDRIAKQAGGVSLQHKALLATDSALPETFDIRGKASLPIQRPDETPIADSWSDFFIPTMPTDNSISGSLVNYWTGLNDDFELAEVGSFPAYCDNWEDGSNSVRGTAGLGNKDDERRLFVMNTQLMECSSTARLLCITH